MDLVTRDNKVQKLSKWDRFRERKSEIIQLYCNIKRK